MYWQGCHGVGIKNFPDFSLTFPWLPTRYIPCGDFLQYIPNHIEITLFIYRCFNIVVLKMSQHKRTFSTSWKLLISCAEHYAKHENKSILEKNHSANKFEWGHDLRFCPSSNINRQTMKNMHPQGPDKIPWLFPHFDSKLQNSLTCNKIPWLFPDSEKDWNFPDFSLTVATLIDVSCLCDIDIDCLYMTHEPCRIF